MPFMEMILDILFLFGLLQLFLKFLHLFCRILNLKLLGFKEVIQLLNFFIEFLYYALVINNFLFFSP